MSEVVPKHYVVRAAVTRRPRPGEIATPLLREAVEVSRQAYRAARDDTMDPERAAILLRHAHQLIRATAVDIQVRLAAPRIAAAEARSLVAVRVPLAVTKRAAER